MTRRSITLWLLWTLLACSGVLWVMDTVAIAKVAEWTKYLSFFFGPIWAMVILIVTKIAELADLPALEVDQLRRLERIVASRQRWLWVYGWLNLLAAFVAVFASLVGEVQSWGRWVVAFALFLVAQSLYFAWYMPLWFDEIRRFRWRLREQEKLEKNKEGLLRDLGKGNPPDVGPLNRSQRAVS